MSKPWLDKLPADLRKTVVDEARGLQAWAIKQSDDEKVALRAKWIERGGEIINLPADDMVELQKRLKPIGAEITKSDPEPQGVLRQGAGHGREILTARPHAEQSVSRSRVAIRPRHSGARAQRGSRIRSRAAWDDRSGRLYGAPRMTADTL